MTITTAHLSSAECKVLDVLADRKNRSTTEVVRAMPRSRSTTMHALRSLHAVGAIVRRDGMDGSNQWRIVDEDEASR